jgi:hypothetical protein
VIVLWRTDPLLRNDTTAAVRQRPPCQWPGWKVVLPARSAPMAVHAIMDTMSGVIYAVRDERGYNWDNV